MRCEVTSSTEHKVLISRELKVPTYKHVCRGEKEKVNFGFNYDLYHFRVDVENKALLPAPRSAKLSRIQGGKSTAKDWEVLNKFFDIFNIEVNWLDCFQTWGHYDQEQDAWTGCMGKVRY